MDFDHFYNIFSNSKRQPPFGLPSPFESRAAMESINLLFPLPGSPCNSVTLPNEIYGYHSHFTFLGSISLALITSRGTVTFISFSICFIVLRSPFRLKTKKPQGRYSEPCFCHFSGRKSGKIAFLSLSKNHTRYLY